MQAAECVDTLQSVLEQLPELKQPTVPPPLSLTLNFIEGASPADALRFAQRLVHAYPSNVWSQALLMGLLDGGLRTKYKQMVSDNGRWWCFDKPNKPSVFFMSSIYSVQFIVITVYL